jgi:aminopeptidase N
VCKRRQPCAARSCVRTLMCTPLLPLQAPFQLQLTAPTGLAALSNTQEVSKQDVGGGRTRRVFAPTPPMSTYLFAMVGYTLDTYKHCCTLLRTRHVRWRLYLSAR